jgi:sRNA-binding regulator protein Hfq
MPNLNFAGAFTEKRKGVTMNRISERVNIAACLGVALLILLPVGRAEGASEKASKLLDLATKKFPTFTEFTEAEEKLFRKVVIGELADCSDRSGKNNDPNGANQWDGKTRVIRADLLAWLCTDAEASAMVTHKGIWIKGARIDGELDLEYAKILFPLSLINSAFMEVINLRQAEIRELQLTGTYTGAIDGSGLKVKGDVCLKNGFKAKGKVDLVEARIEGNFDCENGRFIDPNGCALNCDRLNIDGSVYLRYGFKAEGEVRFSGATIGINLDCEKGEFINKGKKALYAYGAKIEDFVLLRNGFKAEGEVYLISATIGRDLDCERGQFINKNEETKAINAYGAKIEGNVFLRKGFKADGEVSFSGATIGKDLDCQKGEFINKGAKALYAYGANIGGYVFLRDEFKADGEVNLTSAIIGRDLDCRKGKFINEGEKALYAESIDVKGDVFLRDGFQAKGQVDLEGATIVKDLICDSGQFINKGAKALVATGVNVKGSIYLRNGFRAEGVVHLNNATIGDRLDFRRGELINPGGIALQADGANVGSSIFFRGGFKAEGVVDLTAAIIHLYFMWINVGSPESVSLCLWSARVGTLYDDVKSWPDEGRLFLHGLVYNEIDDKAPRDAKKRIDWLRLQPDFRPQPYEQLAEVFRKSGQDEDAKRILIAKNHDKAKLTKLTTWSDKCWYRVLGPMIGYGYRPLNALWGVVAFVGLGCVLFGIGYWGGLITPQSESAYVERDTKIVITGDDKRNLSDVYPRFNFLVYSVDTFVPLIDLHQAKYWLPNANRGPELLNIKAGGLLRLYLWVHITMGWAITMLLVAGLTGLIRT